MDIKEYELHLQSSQACRHPWEMARAEVIRLLLYPIIKAWAGREKTVFDVGCGDGYLLRRLYSTWPVLHYVGIDSALDETMRNQILKRAPVDHFQLFQRLDQIPSSIGHADLLLLLDVLEHVEQDQDFLQKTTTFLKRDGLLLITVPAYPFLFSNHDRWLGHYRRYTSAMLSEITASADLRVLRSGYFFSGLVFPRAVSKCLTSVGLSRRENTGIGRWEQGKFLGHLLSACLSWNAFVDILIQTIKIPWFGLSGFLVCQKSIS